MSRLTLSLSVGGTALIVILVAALAWLTVEYSHVSSPDGRFYAVARYPAWQSLVPLMPGQTGDHAGAVTIYQARGKSCGSARVPMVSFIRDLRWDKEHARIPLVAEWDLIHGRIEENL